MVWRNSLTERLQISYPIIQAPMLGVSTPEMAAAVSNEGGLGSLAVGGLSPEDTRQLIRKTKSLTGKPFAVNLFAHSIPACTDDDLEAMRSLILELANKRGYQLAAADLAGFALYNHLDQVDILTEEGVSIVSFTFGCLDAGSIRTLKQAGCILAGTATCVEEALFLQEQDIDMVVVQGIEAGGHRGTFLENIPLPQEGLFSLLPSIKKLVRIPCIAAGAINHAGAIKTAFELGADGVQIGTAFIGTNESLAIAGYKNRLNGENFSGTALTRAFSGRWARGIRNMLMNEIEQSGIPIPPYPLQNSLTARLRKLAQQNNDSEYTTLWAGTAPGKSSFTQTKEVFRDLVEGYELLNK